MAGVVQGEGSLCFYTVQGKSQKTVIWIQNLVTRVHKMQHYLVHPLNKHEQY